MKHFVFFRNTYVLVAVLLVSFAVGTVRVHAMSMGEVVELLIALDIISADKATQARAIATQQNESDCAPYTRDLRLGSSGNDVARLQTFLEVKQLLTMPFGVGKGFFWYRTEKGLKKYQEIHDLQVTGVFDQATRSVVYKEQCGDTETPPTPQNPIVVAITVPVADAVVSDTVSVAATVSGGNNGISGVQFKRDGENLGQEDVSAPYSISWDTKQVDDGDHTLTAVARDAAGNTQTSSPRTVVVSNDELLPTASFAYLVNDQPKSTDVDPLVPRVWKWSSTNADSYRAFVTISNCVDTSQNGTVDPWDVFGTANPANGKSTNKAPGASRYGCHFKATYIAKNTTTEREARADFEVQFVQSPQ